MAGNSIYVRIDFDSPLASIADEQRFVELLAKELEFGDLHDNHYYKTGWGMRQARVMKVRQHKPKRGGSPIEKSIEVEELDFNSVIWPDDPMRRRFELRGIVTKGIAAAVGRRVVARFSTDALLRLNQDIVRLLNTYHYEKED